MTDKNLEGMARMLEKSGEYKILRKVDLETLCSNEPTTAFKRGCILDVETTGTDPRRDEIIQLSMLPFTFSIDVGSRIIEVLPSFNAYRQPSRPISATITALTGIDDARVAGQVIDPIEVQKFLEPIDLVISHNAAFDFAFLLELAPFAALGRAWACSMTQVPWKAEGFRGLALSYLAMQSGHFSQFHDSGEDCVSVLALLTQKLPLSGRTAMSHLVEAASQTQYRLYAKDAPYDRKELLKERGYHWSNGENGRQKGWYTDVGELSRDAEIEFLQREILGSRGSIKAITITAENRFGPDL